MKAKALKSHFMERMWLIIDIGTFINSDSIPFIVGAVVVILGIRLLRVTLKIAGTALIIGAAIYFGRLLF